MTSIKDIAWLAGIIEGEGYIAFASGLEITVAMTDEDVINHVAKLWNRHYTKEYRPKQNNKAVYSTSVYGKNAISWMMTLYSFLHARRRARIKESIITWLKNGALRPNSTICKRGHALHSKNTYINTKGVLVCRRCSADNSKFSRAKKKLAGALADGAAVTVATDNLQPKVD